MTTIITQTTGTGTEVHENAVAGAVATGETQPKDGLRGLASRMRRAFGRDKAEPAPLAASEAGAELQGPRASVQALARSLLKQDRTGEPLDPETESDFDAAEAFAAEDAWEAEEAESAEVEEPKTIPRAKSVPPPLPTVHAIAGRADQDGASVIATAQAQEAVPVETAAPATEPPAPSRSAQLRARLAAAKAQRAEALATLAEAPQSDASVEPEPMEQPEAHEAQAAQEATEELEATAAAEELEATASVEELAHADAADDLDEFEDLEASALVEEPVSATR